jgi:hypothetical protein
MKCPYCKAEMARGNIYGDRYALKWMPEGKSLLLGIWAVGGIKIGSGGVLGRPKAEANMCQACRKLIVDI